MDHNTPVKLKFDFKEIGITLFGLVFWIFIGIPLLGPLFLWKMIVVIPLAKKLRPDLVPISRIDSLVVFSDSKSNPVANPCQVWKLRGYISLEKFREHFHKCFLSSEQDQRQHENLLCYFVEFLGFMFKKRIPLEELDLSEHIREISVNELNLFYKLHAGDSSYISSNNISKEDANSNTAEGSSASESHVDVDSFIGKWMASCTYQKNKPQWEILLIHMDDGTTTVCFKIDHGLCDGYSFVHLVDKLSGTKSPYLFPSAAPLSFKKKVTIFVKAPFVAIWYLWTKIIWHRGLFDPVLSNHSATFAPARNATASTKPPEWFLSFASLDLDLVKAIRRKTNTHFVTVLMSVLSGTIRRFILETMAEETKDDDDDCEEYLPNFIHMGHSLGWPNHPAMSTKSSTKLCNHLSMASYAVPVTLENPLERLLACEDVFKEYEKQSGPEIFNYVVMRIMWILPGFAKRYLQKVDFGFLRFTCFFSSLILSPQPISLLGVPVRQLTLPLVLPSVTPTCGLFVVVTTHSGQLELSINASSKVFRSQMELDRFTQQLFPNELRTLGETLRVCD